MGRQYFCSGVKLLNLPPIIIENYQFDWQQIKIVYYTVTVEDAAKEMVRLKFR